MSSDKIKVGTDLPFIRVRMPLREHDTKIAIQIEPPSVVVVIYAATMATATVSRHRDALEAWLPFPLP
jgi:hypothetical protein